jgi:alkaline phosphatase D
LPTAVIVWTRYTPASADETVTLEFRMAAIDPSLPNVEDHLDPAQNLNLHRAIVKVTKDSDFIAKMDVTGLMSGTNYVFGFSVMDDTIATESLTRATSTSITSQIGQTKTAPGETDVVDVMTYAVFSCAHFSNGYFHSYDVGSTIEDLDFWVHVGDYGT